MNPFGMLVRAFRAAVRSEVERALADRRRAVAPIRRSISDESVEKIAIWLSERGLEPCVLSGDNADVGAAAQTARGNVIPFPAANANHSEPPPTAA